VTSWETHKAKALDQGYKIRIGNGLPEPPLELEAGRINTSITNHIQVLRTIRWTNARSDGSTPRRCWVLPTKGAAILQGGPDPANAMQDALDAMQADGAYLTIANYWAGDDIR